MKTIIALALVSFLCLFAGCGDNLPAESVDAGPGDACVAGQGNCGCIIEQTISYTSAPGSVVVVCPLDAGH